MLTIQVRLPDSHPADEPVFMAGTLNGWLPGDVNYRLRYDEQRGTHRLEIPQPPHEMQYKYTRGTWAAEEVNVRGQPIENRVWTNTYSPGSMKQDDVIAAWRDIVHQHTDSLSTSVFVWQEALWMPLLNRSRRIWACLPPDYQRSTGQRYPVVYMHDAQNLFDQRTDVCASWRVPQTMQQLFEATNWGCLVIGIEHGDQHRLDEYAPVAHPEHGGGQGLAYLRFLVETLKPLVDRTFRTRPDSSSTAMIGSSMGGLISVYAALLHGDVFGKVAAFSPSLWWRDDVYQLAASTPYPFVHKLVLLGGQPEGPTMLPDLMALYYTLIDNGYFEHKLHVDFYQDGSHQEWFWGRELERTLRWLFSDEMPPMVEEALVYLDLDTRQIQLQKPFVRVNLLNSYGKVICTLDGKQGNIIELRPHWRGMFALQCLLPNQRIELKKIRL